MACRGELGLVMAWNTEKKGKLKMVYKWRYYNYPIDANVVGRALEEIEKEHGEITAKLLLEKATPKSSELHSLFTWDNRKAAEKWRLHEARLIITAVAVVYDQDEHPEDHTIRAFANVGTRQQGSFVTMAKALSDEESRAVVLKHALEELRAFQSKYSALEELSEVFSAIKALKAG